MSKTAKALCLELADSLRLRPSEVLSSMLLDLAPALEGHSAEALRSFWALSLHALPDEPVSQAGIERKVLWSKLLLNSGGVPAQLDYVGALAVGCRLVVEYEYCAELPHIIREVGGILGQAIQHLEEFEED